MSDDLNWLSAREMARRFAKGDLSPVDVLEATLAQLHTVNPVLNAICLLDEPQGRRLAAESAERWRRGTPLGPLDGVPVAIKDTAHVAGWPTRIGSHATAAAPSTEDTPGVARLREAGAVFFCKTTTPEFGWKGITARPADRHHAQSLGYVPHARRLQRRLGRVGGGRRRAAGDRRRWRRLASGFRRRSAACSD